MIHGEAYKPIVSEATKKVLPPEDHYERVFISHLFTDADDPNRIAGAVGFGVREDVIYIFKARSVISAAGGATAIFRPRSVGEGMGRTWYSIFDTGSVYGLIIPIGGEMTQMEHRFVPSRFKDSYGPVGAWSQLFRADLTNAAGENYFINRLPELKKVRPLRVRLPDADAAAEPPAVDRNTGRQRSHHAQDSGGDRRVGGRRRGPQAGHHRRGVGRLPGHDHFAGHPVGGPQHRAGGTAVRGGAGRAVHHGQPQRGGRRLGERTGGRGARRVSLGLQQDDHGERTVRSRRRRGSVSAQVLVGFLHRGPAGRQIGGSVCAGQHDAAQGGRPQDRRAQTASVGSHGDLRGEPIRILQS